MLIKVCGMRDPDNVKSVTRLAVDMIGFILFDRSPRYVSEVMLALTPDNVARVGVFVNEDICVIEELAGRHNLQYIQLHGDETPQMCEKLREKGCKVIKAISVSAAEDFNGCSQYEGHVDILLFDTKSTDYGGSGRSFDWALLDHYKGSVPFMLSGGISGEDIDKIKGLNHSMLLGIDLNSRFEISPAMKDVQKLEKFIKQIK